MIKILFFIHDLGNGGAEKALVNLVNNMNQDRYDITVISLFGGGINERSLQSHVTYQTVFRKEFRGNIHLLKLLSPKHLHSLFIKDIYDIEIAYLEGPSARIISGCTNKKTKLISWIHSTINSQSVLSRSFRSFNEAVNCYNHMDSIVFVSNAVRDAFLSNFVYLGDTNVLYNPFDTDYIREKALETIDILYDDSFRLMAMGTLKKVKGFDRLLKVTKQLRDEKLPIHLYILGNGPQRVSLEKYIKNNSLETCITLLGYDANPYKYLSKGDLFICSSYSEGFSTAVVESLILGVPVCTTNVSGMHEILGDNNEYGVIVDNNEKALYLGIKELILQRDKYDYYKNKAKERGEQFGLKSSIDHIQAMIENSYSNCS